MSANGSPQTDERPDASPPRPPTSGVHKAVKAPPPVLASDALREDLAPLEPGRRASRIWGACLAAGLFAVGVWLKLRLGLPRVSPDAAPIAFAAAVATGMTAALPFPYVWRALVGALVGVAVCTLGLLGAGPLALLAAPGVSSNWVEVARIAAATAVPAAILFRSHYRAYRRGPPILAAALVVSLPFLVHAGHALVVGPGVIARVGAGLALAAVASALIAFLGTAPPESAAWWAESVTALVGADVALRAIHAHTPPAGAVAQTLTAVTFILCASPMALGLFQALAAAFARDARRVEVKIHAESKTPATPTET